MPKRSASVRRNCGHSNGAGKSVLCEERTGLNPKWFVILLHWFWARFQGQAWYRWSVLCVVFYFFRPSAPKRSGLLGSMEYGMAPLWEKLSKRSRSANMRSTTAISAARYCLFFLSWSQDSLKRKAAGIWECKACKKVLAGGAYVSRYSLCFCYALF